MRKLSFLLVLALVFSTMCVGPVSAFAANNVTDDMANTLLEDLGIVHNFDSMKEGITRAEFTSLVVSAINIGNLTDTPMLPYNDVSEEHMFYSAIYDAYALGLISSASVFDPDRIITFNEACKIAVTAAGYDFLANAYGGWPTGFVSAASSKDLLDGISGNGFTKQNAYTLIYNMLGCKLPLMEFSNGEVLYKIDSGSTLIESMWHLTKISATFDGGQYFGGEFGTGVGSGRASIGGTTIKSGDYNTDSFFGEYADAYVTEDGILYSLYVYTHDKKSNILTISSKQNPSVSNLVYTYEEDDDTIKTAAIAPDALLVFNGHPISYDEAKLTPAYGSVKLIKNGGSYNIVIVESYRQMVVGTVFYDELYISDVYNVSNVYKCQNADGLTVYDVHNEKVDFSMIGKFSVLWIYESFDGMNDVIILCDDLVNGELTGTTDSHIEIDNVAYEITPEARSAMDSTISIGSVLTCSVNPERKIVYVRLAGSATDSNIGYITYGAVTGSGFDKVLSIEILTTDGILRTYKVGKKALVNGISLGTDADTQYSKMPHEANVASVKTGIAAYKLNDDGQIASINYADKVSAGFGGTYDSLFQKQTLDGTTDEYVRFKSTYNSIIGKTSQSLFVTSDTLQFIVPAVEDRSLANEKNYKIMKVVQYASGTALTGYINTGYSFNKDTVYSDYIASTYNLGSVGGNVSGLLSVVESISSVINEAGEPVCKLSLWNGQKKNFVVYSDKLDYFDSLGIKPGDVVKVDYNSNNTVSAIILFAHAEDMTMSPKAKFNDGNVVTDATIIGFTSELNNCVATNNSGMGVMASSYILMGKIYNVDGDVVQLIPTHIDPENVNEETDIYSFSFKATPVHKFSTKSHSVEQVEVSSLKSYKNSGASCQKMVIENTSGNLCSGFVIE